MKNGIALLWTHSIQRGKHEESVNNRNCVFFCNENGVYALCIFILHMLWWFIVQKGGNSMPLLPYMWSSMPSIYSALNYFYHHCSIVRCIFILCFQTWGCRQKFSPSINEKLSRCIRHTSIMMWHRHTDKHINKQTNLNNEKNNRSNEQRCRKAAHLPTKLNRMHVKSTGERNRFPLVVLEWMREKSTKT